MRSCLALFLVLLSIATPALADEIKVSTGEWPPYVSQKTKVYGVCGEVVAAACRAAGLTPRFEFHPWKRAYRLVRKAKVDVSFPWARNPDRLKDCYFSDALIHTRFVFFYRKGVFPEGLNYRDLQDLKGLTLGGTTGYWYVHKFKQEKLKVDYSSYPETTFRKLYKGRVDLAVEDEQVGWSVISAIFSGQESCFAASRQALKVNTQHIIVSKKLPGARKLMDRINHGLEVIKRNGKYHDIMKKYGIY